MKKRYFIVFFIIKKGDTISYLHSDFTTFSNKYLNKNSTYKLISEENGVEKSKISITNIIELNYEEYKNWIS